MVLIPGSVVYVDEFRVRRAGYAFFLSHAHADHYDGLGPAWSNGPIYCTHATRAVMISRMPPLEPWLVALDEGEDGDSILIGESRQVELRVRVIDARHCPGSAMFLFSGYFGEVLYTGDFRLEAGVLESPEFREQYPFLFDQVLDHLLVDNTHQALEMLPARSAMEQLLIELVDLYPSNTVFRLGLEFGKEELAVRLGAHLNTKVQISQERINEYRAMGATHLADRMVPVGSAEDQFGRTDARIIAVPRTDINERQVRAWNSAGRPPTIGILLMGNCALGRRTVQLGGKFPPTVFASHSHLAHMRRLAENKGASSLPRYLLAPYTLHGSLAEVESFVASVPHLEFRGFVKPHVGHRLESYARGMPARRRAELDQRLEQVRPQLFALTNRRESKQQAFARTAGAVRALRAEAAASRDFKRDVARLPTVKSFRKVKVEGGTEVGEAPVPLTAQIHRGQVSCSPKVILVKEEVQDDDKVLAHGHGLSGRASVTVSTPLQFPDAARMRQYAPTQTERHHHALAVQVSSTESGPAVSQRVSVMRTQPPRRLACTSKDESGQLDIRNGRGVTWRNKYRRNPEEIPWSAAQDAIALAMGRVREGGQRSATYETLVALARSVDRTESDCIARYAILRPAARKLARRASKRRRLLAASAAAQQSCERECSE